MSTPLPLNLADLPAHQARALSSEERAALAPLEWTEAPLPQLPPSFNVKYVHGRQSAADQDGEWTISAERKGMHVEIAYANPFPKGKEEWEARSAAMKEVEMGSLEWHLLYNQYSPQDLGRAGNQEIARIAIDALIYKSCPEEVGAAIEEAGFSYRHTVVNGEGLPTKIYYKDLGDTHFLQFNVSPISASLMVEENDSGYSDLLVSFYTNETTPDGCWIPKAWPSVVEDPARNIVGAALEVNKHFEQRWSPSKRKLPKP